MPNNIICVVPTIRPESMRQFKDAWEPLFKKHGVTLITVWDGDRPEVECSDDPAGRYPADALVDTREEKDLFFRRTDACRNWGFLAAAKRKPEYILTFDDDVLPPPEVYTGGITHDPVKAHLSVLHTSAPLTWMNTAHDDMPWPQSRYAPYLRGVPYGVRGEAPVMLSHGVWIGTPDFDGETQLSLEESTLGVPLSLPYYRGPVPKGVLFPLCGMNVMVRREALPYLYFAPMGPDTGIEGLNRFADIWMGVFLKREFDNRRWVCYTGASTVLHSRASDARKNMEQEKLGREWNEKFWKCGVELCEPCEESVVMNDYFYKYAEYRRAYRDLITKTLGAR